MNRELINDLRNEYLSSLNTHIAWIESWDGLIEYRTYLTLTPEMRADERCTGILLRERLKSMRFECLPGEPLVTRLGKSEGAERVDRQKARDFIWGARTGYWGLHGCGAGGHFSPAYEKVLRGGMDALRAEVKRHQQASPCVFYENVLMALDGFEALIGHAADAAEAAGNTDSARICRKLMHEAPENFREALQMVMFVQLAIEKGDRSGPINPGRLDRILAPYLPVDSYDDMVTLLAYFYLGINWNAPAGLAYGVMVCGDTPANKISYACLEACRLCNLSYPTVGVCINDDTPTDIQQLAVDIVSEGNPNPAFFGDTTIRRGLESYGVPREESGDYINSTCVEITPCGKSNVYVASTYYNLCKHLLNAMTADCDSYDAFIEAFKNSLAAELKQTHDWIEEYRVERNSWRRRPLQSLFIDDCLERGLDVECGGARYNWVECSFVGIANFVDSLVIIRKTVFEDKRFTMTQLREMCENDFKDNEAIRQEFMTAFPKYGQGNEAVDRLVPEFISFAREELAKHHYTPNDSPWIPGTFCWVMHQRFGSETCATPDGRHSGFPLADGAGPAQGREIFGPTAAIQSVTSWDHSPLIGGLAFNMKFSKTAMSSPDARAKLLALIQTYLKRGGFQTQINVVDAETLIDADKHPENYRDLLVRIGGYSDFFTRLTPEMRKEVIMRTQNAL